MSWRAQIPISRMRRRLEGLYEFGRLKSLDIVRRRLGRLTVSFCQGKQLTSVPTLADKQRYRRCDQLVLDHNSINKLNGVERYEDLRTVV
jgi:hypothetical protein